jgi:hypothetical protein
LDDWLYSNYLEWVGKRAGTLYDEKFVREQFTNPDEYKEFVLDYVPSNKMNQTIQTLSMEN